MMPCVTCDKTLTPLGCCLVMGQPIHYCVTCGSVKPCGVASEDIVVPELVRRCREFEKIMVAYQKEYDRAGDGDFKAATDDLAEHWHRLGVAEAINLPEDRKL